MAGAQHGAPWRATGCFYGVIQWSLRKENELGSCILNLSSVVRSSIIDVREDTAVFLSNSCRGLATAFFSII